MHTLFIGNVYDALDEIPDESVDIVITSPPYWGQRDYGIPGQIGIEKTPEEYIGKFISIFKKLFKKVSNEGVIFFNVGDKYKNKSLMQIPYYLAYMIEKHTDWKVADILIWYKTNHMPSPIKDRLTNTYEPVIVFVKNKQKNIYNPKEKVLKISLKPSKWKHTAPFPDKLVEKLIEQCNLEEKEYTIMDPFAGTGTVGVVSEKYNNGMFNNFSSILIEKNRDYARIILERLQQPVVTVEVNRETEIPVVEVHKEMVANLEYIPPMSSKYGEIFEINNNSEMLQIISFLVRESTEHNYYRPDALFFIIAKKWNIRTLYYSSLPVGKIYLRNMIVVEEQGVWYPVFIYALQREYRFFLDNVREKHHSKPRIRFKVVEGTPVKKNGKIIGKVVKIFEMYDEIFPKIIAIHIDETDEIMILPVFHPFREEEQKRGIILSCPSCHNVVKEYDKYGDNICQNCQLPLYRDINTLPIPYLNKELKEIIDKVETLKSDKKLISELKEKGRNLKPRKMIISKTKYKELDRINRGTSPFARETIEGGNVLLTTLIQPHADTVTIYLRTLVNKKQLKGKIKKDRLNKLFSFAYKIIPNENDLKYIMQLSDHSIWKLMSIKAGSIQMVKYSIKGKNPGDYLVISDYNMLINFLKKLYLENEE